MARDYSPTGEKSGQKFDGGLLGGVGRGSRGGRRRQKFQWEENLGGETE